MIHVRYEFLCVIREVTLPKIKNKMVSSLTCLGDKCHVKSLKNLKMNFSQEREEAGHREYNGK